MQKMFSKELNKHFYVDELQSMPVNGIPCFNEYEIQHLKENKLTIFEKQEIFRIKCSGGLVQNILPRLRKPAWHEVFPEPEKKVDVRVQQNIKNIVELIKSKKIISID